MAWKRGVSWIGLDVREGRWRLYLRMLGGVVFASRPGEAGGEEVGNDDAFG